MLKIITFKTAVFTPLVISGLREATCANSPYLGVSRVAVPPIQHSRRPSGRRENGPGSIPTPSGVPFKPAHGIGWGFPHPIVG